MDLLLLLVAVVADIPDPHDGVRHDFFFEGQVPILHSAVGVMGIEQSDVETARQQPRVSGVDDRVGRIDSGDVLRNASAARSLAGRPVREPYWSHCSRSSRLPAPNLLCEPTQSCSFCG